MSKICWNKNRKKPINAVVRLDSSRRTNNRGNQWEMLYTISSSLTYLTRMWTVYEFDQGTKNIDESLYGAISLHSWTHRYNYRNQIPDRSIKYKLECRYITINGRFRLFTIDYGNYPFKYYTTLCSILVTLAE